jgi:hypothetical protein
LKIPPLLGLEVLRTETKTAMNAKLFWIIFLVILKRKGIEPIGNGKDRNENVG